jgi:hypothetical protein
VKASRRAHLEEMVERLVLRRTPSTAPRDATAPIV